MKQLSPFSIKLPLDVRQWIEQQAGQRKMTMTDYVLQLLVKGIQAESIDATVARIKDACDGGGPCKGRDPDARDLGHGSMCVGGPRAGPDHAGRG
jgi:hypothetical protein